MKSSKTAGWSRLDNAAKIFPSTSSKTDTSVFRFYCELLEPVQPELLQKALEQTLVDFPRFGDVLRKGAFWYYLESSDKTALVTPEADPVCAPIYEGDNGTLLLRVSYFQTRINLEIFHALCDGTGALQFLKTVVFHYLKAAHSDRLAKDLVFSENTASFAQQNSDGFSKYYKKEKSPKAQRNRRVYNLKYRRGEDRRLRVTEAIVSAAQAVELAHRHKTSLTVFLTALLISAIHEEMSLQDEKQPVVIMVPVNLRQFFPSETTKNFFSLIDISYDFSRGTKEFSHIIETVNHAFKEKLTPAVLSAKMNRFAAMERNFFAKIAPLPLKDLSLKCARHIENLHETAVISNLGRVSMPPELCPYIDSFGVLASTLGLQLCMCSFGDKLQIGFTSAFISTEVQKNFIRALTSQGVEAVVRSSRYFRKEGV